MALNFPSSPPIDTEYTFGTKTWIYNGFAWDLKTNATHLLEVLKTVDGTDSGLDADLLDGSSAIDFYPSSNPSGYINSSALSDYVPLSGATLTNFTVDSILNSVGADHLHFKIKSTEAITKGSVVKVTGYNSGENAIEVAKVSSASDIAVGVAHETLDSGEFGAVINTGLLEGVNTSAFSVGTILYPNTSGGFTSTKPTSGTYQALAYVMRSHANNGTILIEATEPKPVLALVATSGAYSNLSGKPTSLSSFTNDQGYLTSSTVGNYALPLSGGTLTGALGVGDVTTATITDQTDYSNPLIIQRSGNAGKGAIVLRGSDSIATAIEFGRSNNTSHWGTYLSFLTHSDDFVGGTTSLAERLRIQSTFINSRVALQQSGNQVLHAGNYSSYALPLSGGTLTGALTVTGGSNSIVVQHDVGSDGNWHGRIISKNATANLATFIGNYASITGVFAHNNALNAWADLYVNTTDGSGGGTVRMPATVLVNGSQVIHAGNYTSYLNSTYMRSIGQASTSNDWNGLGNTYPNTIEQVIPDNFSSTANGPTAASYTYGTLLNFSSQSSSKAQIYISHSGNDLIFRGGWGNDSWQTWNKVLTNQNYSSYSPGYLGSGGALRIVTPSGWAEIGPMNSSWCHVYSDKNFYFNQGIWINNSRVLDASNYYSYALPLSGGTVTGVANFLSDLGGYAGSLSSPSLQVYSTANNSAFLSFHKAGNYAINMGLDADNVFRIGGWSASSNRLQMDMSGNLTMAGNITAYSDETLKKDWAVLAEDFVDRLAVVKSGTYTRIDSGARQGGCSAQDWQQLLPEVVSIDNDGKLGLAYGNAALVSAVALAKRVVLQENRIQRLEALIEQLLNKDN